MSCSVFARVIVALLAEAETPELEHLWVITNDQPCTAGERWKGEDGQHSETNEEHRYADEHNRHPRRKIESEFGPRSVQRRIDR